jgi:hypothetical protein
LKCFTFSNFEFYGLFVDESANLQSFMMKHHRLVISVQFYQFNQCHYTHWKFSFLYFLQINILGCVPCCILRSPTEVLVSQRLHSLLIDWMSRCHQKLQFNNEQMLHPFFFAIIHIDHSKSNDWNNLGYIRYLIHYRYRYYCSMSLPDISCLYLICCGVLDPLLLQCCWNLFIIK